MSIGTNGVIVSRGHPVSDPNPPGASKALGVCVRFQVPEWSGSRLLRSYGLGSHCSKILGL